MRRFLILTVVLGTLLGRAQAAPAASSASSSQAERSLEGALLHRRIDLGGLAQRQRLVDSWQRPALGTARVRVLNLWSRSCKPCIWELPTFRSLIEKYPAVPFLFIADPAEENSREEIARFWARPLVQLPAGQVCQGVVPPRGGESACLLALPAVQPVRSEDDRLRKSIGEATVRPITLLVDGGGIVRQAFVGSVQNRISELEDAIARIEKLPANCPTAADSRPAARTRRDPP